MAAETDSPMTPCPKCSQLFAAAEAACPHCGAAREVASSDAATRRLFLYTALGAGALGAAGVAAFWDRIRAAFRDGGGGRMQTLYGPPPRPMPVPQPPSNGGELYGVPRAGGGPPVAPVEPALADREVAEAYGRHAMADYDAAAAAYRKVLGRTPPVAQADRVRLWLEDAEAKRPPRK